MPGIIIVFPKLEDANSIKSLLIRNGFEVNAVCTTGAQAISIANGLDEGIVISGYRMPDMIFREMNGYLPKGFEMLLIASAARVAEATGDIMAVSMPLKSRELILALQAMERRHIQHKKQEKEKPQARSGEEKAVIEKAKSILMQRSHMSEEEAHRYIQKNSMDSGTNLVEMAEMIISML